jgi:transposase
MGDDQRKGKRARTEDLRNLVKSVRGGAFNYEERAKGSLDWSSYDEAQVNELADMLRLIKKFVDMAAERVPVEHQGPGRPPYPPADVAKALLLQSYFGVSNRVAAGLAGVFKEKLGMSSEFGYKTIERGYDPSPVTAILQEVFKLTNELGNAKETAFSTDGTGDPSSAKVNYESVRSEQRKREKEAGSWPSQSPLPPPSPSSPSPAQSRHDFQYSVSSVGVHTKIIAGFRSTDDHSTGELSLFPSVLAQTHANCPQMEVMLGDSIYANRVACAMVAGYGAIPYFFPKSNSTLRSHGVPAWSDMTLGLVADPQRWLEEYHMRSISETVNSMEEARLPTKVRKKLSMRRNTEEFLKQDVHNLRRYGYLGYLQPKMINPVYW